MIKVVIRSDQVGITTMENIVIDGHAEVTNNLQHTILVNGQRLSPWAHGHRGCNNGRRWGFNVTTCAADWFADEADFRQICGDAQSQARAEGAQIFAAQMMIAANNFGLRTYLSEKQLKWLCQLADWDIPMRIAR